MDYLVRFTLLLLFLWLVNTNNPVLAKDIKGTINYGDGFHENIYGGKNSKVEYLSPDKNWEVRYNPLVDKEQKDFTIQPKGAKLKYNPFSGDFEWDSGKQE